MLEKANIDSVSDVPMLSSPTIPTPVFLLVYSDVIALTKELWPNNKAKIQAD